MNIATTTVDATTVIRLNGDLDTNSSPEAQAAIDSLIDGGVSHLLVNLAEVGFVSSTGLRVLLSAAKRLTGAGGSLKISNLNDTVREVFEISGFITILKVFDSEAEALQDA